MTVVFSYYRRLTDGLVVVETRAEHAPELEELQRVCFPTLADEERFKAAHYRKHVELFPEGQFVVLDGSTVVAATTTLRLRFDFDHFDHTFAEIIQGGWLTSHDPEGDWLYGADIGVHPAYRGRGIARALYAARQELVWRLGLKGQVTAGMMRGYGALKDRMTAQEYYTGIVAGTITDPTLSVQLRVGFEPRALLANYLNDPVCDNYSVLIVLDADKDVPGASPGPGARAPDLDGELMEYIYKQLIDGEWCDASSGGVWEVRNPATEDIVRTVPYGGADDCRSAIDAAQRAFRSWADRTPYDRGAILARAADLMRERAAELARTTVVESGKPLEQARREWIVAADLFEWFAEEGRRAYGRVVPSRAGGKRLLVLKQPVGVVGIITAWNFPAYNVARAAAAALAAGCTVVIRPSEYTPLTAMAMVNILVEAGTPRGVANLVNGEADPMGQEMLRHPACAKVHLTGSVRVGKHLLDGASKTMTRLSLELGGNAPVLVFPDVDLTQLAESAVAAKFRNTGQVCVSPQRFLVDRRVADEFVDRVAARVASLRVGSGLDPDTEVGPLINATQRNRVEALVESARSAGAAVRVGGMRPSDRPRGYFYQPTLVADVQPSTDLFEQEIFGPVMPVASFDAADEAVAIANQTRYGLAAYVWTNDLRTAMRVAERLEFGMVGVNEWTPHAVEAPFVGWKESGLGREGGVEGLEEYLETKLVAFGGL